MHNHNGPFLSAAAIRRVLALHAFSPDNRAYLTEEATRREGWERELESFLEGLPPVPQPAPGEPLAARETGDAGVFPLRHLQVVPPH